MQRPRVSTGATKGKKKEKKETKKTEDRLTNGILTSPSPPLASSVSHSPGTAAAVRGVSGLAWSASRSSRPWAVKEIHENQCNYTMAKHVTPERVKKEKEKRKEKKKKKEKGCHLHQINVMFHQFLPSSSNCQALVCKQQQQQQKTW